MVRKFLSTSNKRWHLATAAVLSAMVASPAMAQGRNLASLAVDIQQQLGAFANLLTGAMFLVGIGLGAMSALKFKAHNEDPRSTKITTPLMLMAVSACLIGLPAYLTYVKNSALGNTTNNGSLNESVYGSIGRN